MHGPKTPGTSPPICHHPPQVMGGVDFQQVEVLMPLERGEKCMAMAGYTTVPLGGPTDDRPSDTSPLRLDPRDMGLDEIFDLTTGTAGWEPMRTTRTPAEWPASPIGSWLGASGKHE